MRFNSCDSTSLHYCLTGADTLIIGGLSLLAIDLPGFVLLPPGVDDGLERASSKSVGVASRASRCLHKQLSVHRDFSCVPCGIEMVSISPSVRIAPIIAPLSSCHHNHLHVRILIFCARDLGPFASCA